MKGEGQAHAGRTGEETRRPAFMVWRKKRSKVLRGRLRLQWVREGGELLCGSDGRRPHLEERVHCWGHRTDGGSEAVQRHSSRCPWQLDFLAGLYFLAWRSSHRGNSQMSSPDPHQCASPTYLILRGGSFRLQCPEKLQGRQVPESFLASHTPDPLPKAFKSLCTKTLKPPDS